MTERIPQRAEELNPEWLTQALRESGAIDQNRVVARSVDPIGAGRGFAGQVMRLHLEYAEPEAAGPASLIVKLPGEIAKNRGAVEAAQGYEREVRFFRELAADCALPTCRCHSARMDPDPRESSRERDRARLEQMPLRLIACLTPLGLWMAARRRRRYLLLLEDLAPRRPGDQIAGCGVERARRAARDLARLHASFWQDPRLPEMRSWLPVFNSAPRMARAAYWRGRPRFLREFGRELPAGFMQATDWVNDHVEAVLDGLAAAPVTLVHGDYRLDNLFFGEQSVFAVDWQGVAQGRGVFDWAYFVVGSLHDDCGPSDEENLLGEYHAALIDLGVRGYAFETCRRDYDLCKLVVAYGNVAAAHLLDLPGARGHALLASMRRRLVRRVPPPPFEALIR